MNHEYSTWTLVFLLGVIFITALISGDDATADTLWEIENEQLRPTSLHNISLFDNDIVPSTQDGNALYIYRKTNTSSHFFKLYVDRYREFVFSTTNRLNWRVADGQSLRFLDDGLGFVTVGDWNMGQHNPEFRHFGFLSSEMDEFYVEWKLDDEDDYYHLTRQGLDTKGFKLNMPIVSEGLTVVGNANITGTIYYGALQAQSPILKRTDDEFVAECTTANNGDFVVEYIKADKGTYTRVIEKVDKNNPNWWHQDCYKKNEMFNFYETIKDTIYTELVEEDVEKINENGEKYFTKELKEKKFYYTLEDIEFDKNTKTAKIKQEKGVLDGNR